MQTADDAQGQAPMPASTDGGDDGSADDAAATPAQAYLRIAQVSPDLPPIDVCVAPHGTTSFRGPLVGLLFAAQAPDAGEDAEVTGAPGVSYAQVSAYLPLDVGPYDVRIVAAGAASCAFAPTLAVAEPLDGARAGAGADGDAGAAPADANAGEATPSDAASSPDDAGGLPDWTELPPLALGSYTTLLVAGDLSPAGNDPGLTVTMLADDAQLAGGSASLRAINAMPSEPSLDFGIESPTDSSVVQWMPLLVDVPFAAASTMANPDDGAVDIHGYLTLEPLSNQTVGTRRTSDAAVDVASANNVTIDFGSIATVIAVGGKTGDASHAPALLLCTDNQPSGGILSDCGLAQ